MTQYYVRRGDEVTGPYRRPELSVRKHAGQLSGGDEIAESPGGPWQRADETEVYRTLMDLEPAEPERKAGSPKPVKAKAKRRDPPEANLSGTVCDPFLHAEAEADSPTRDWSEAAAFVNAVSAPAAARPQRKRRAKKQASPATKTDPPAVMTDTPVTASGGQSSNSPPPPGAAAPRDATDAEPLPPEPAAAPAATEPQPPPPSTGVAPVPTSPAPTSPSPPPPAATAPPVAAPPPAPPVAIAEDAPTARRPLGRGYWWLFGATAAALAICFTAAVTMGALFWQSRSSDAARTQAQEAELALKEAKLADLQERIDAAESTVEAAESAAERAAAEQKQLDQRHEELKAQIDRLTTRLERLRPWQSVELVVVSPGRTATGLTELPGGYAFAAVTGDGVSPDDAVRIARKAGASFVPHDPSLAGDLAAEFDAGAAVDRELAHRISVHKRDLRVAAESVGVDSNWVTFQTVTPPTRHVGFFVSADEETLQYSGTDGRLTEIRRSEMIPGSAIRGTVDDLTYAIDEAAFLKHAVFATAVRMQHEARGGQYVCLAVDVDVQRVDRSASRAARPDIDAITSPYDQTLTRTDNGGLTFGTGGWQVGLTSSTTYETLAHPTEDALFRLVLADAKQELLAQDMEDARRLRALEGPAGELEAAVGMQLADLGVPVMPVRLMRELAAEEEAAPAAGPFSEELLKMSGVSHQIRVRLSGPPASPRLRLTLVDLRSGRVLYDVTGRRPDEPMLAAAVRRGTRFRRFFLTSGRMAVLTPRQKWDSNKQVGDDSRGRGEDDFRPIETPALVRRGGRGTTTEQEILVYLEDDPTAPLNSSAGETVVYRPLFSRQRHRMPRGTLSSVRLVDGAGDVPGTDMFRYQVAKLATAVLPQAGRLARVDGSRAVVSIAPDSALKAGDHLRLMRFDDSVDDLALNRASPDRRERMLPVRLRVADVQRDHVIAHVEPTGFETIWPADYRLEVGDIVLPPRAKTRPAVIVPLAFTPPPAGTEIDREWRGGRSSFGPEKWVRESQSLALRFTEAMAEASSELAMPVRFLPTAGQDAFVGSPKTDRRSRRNDDVVLRPTVAAIHQAQIAAARRLPGAAYVFGGTVQPVTRNSYLLQTGVIPVDQGLAAEMPTEASEFSFGSGLLP